MSTRESGETVYELQGSGPAVALILNRAMWQWQLPALVPHFKVLTYDLLGHGDSARPAGAPDLVMFSEQLFGVMDCCGIEREAILKRVRHAQGSGPSSTADAALERWFTAGFRVANPGVMMLIREWIVANDPAVYPEIYRVLAEGDAEIARDIDRISSSGVLVHRKSVSSLSGNWPPFASVDERIFTARRLQDAGIPDIGTRGKSNCAIDADRRRRRYRAVPKCVDYAARFSATIGSCFRPQ